ncbi:ABC transporter permease [Geothrix sp. PMB-07]|uniref:ABC transporter permease n=1 Tax=Geothrix sp. PMB-07 TaxID=3068640 RepID=UPI002741E377|nr:FtsX-like permease family protein [Geothrix sp. PMB-07]WLT31546.1 FtsX-like permease family protein [Geothrix sp. PMB-07]
MNWLVRRLVLRALLREWGRALLTLAAVALGVAVFLSIRLANRAAVASFEQFTQGVGQGSDLVMRADAGPLRESLLPGLRPLTEWGWMRPVIEGSFARTGTLEAFQLMGLDLVGIGSARDEAASSDQAQVSTDGTAAFYTVIQDPHAVLITAALAAEGLRPGDVLEGYVQDRPVRLRAAGVLPERPNQPRLQRNLLVMDLPAAQKALGREGELDRLEWGLRPGARLEDLEAAARRLLPPGLALEPPEQRAESGRTMTAAFRFNLTILSLIALAVGAYLLFQAFDASVNRRRETWATLRALGQSPSGVLGLVLGEAALLGLLGSLLGLGLGWLLAQVSVRAVSQTVNALYGASAARSAALHGGESALAIAAGLLACLLAAWIPARRAAGTPPVQLLARDGGPAPLRWGLLGLSGGLALLLGLAFAYGVHPSPGVAWHAYLGSAFALLGGSLLAVALMPLLGQPGHGTRRWRLRLALRPLRRPTGRHGFAAAALAVAVGMATGMGVMVESFERTVLVWIGSSLRADLYVAPLGAAGAGTQHRLSGETAEAVAADPAVAAADRFQMLPISFRGRPTFLGAGDMGIQAARGGLILAAGGPFPGPLLAMRNGGLRDPGALVSETFARHFGVKVGEVLDLPVPGGTRSVTVRGVLADYGNERGSLILDRPVFLAWFGDARVASLALYLRPGETAELVAARLRRDHPALQVRSNGALRAQVTTIFRQTFALTYALEAIGLLVAVLGLGQGLTGLALARRGEIWSLRALGATRADLTLILMLEGLGVALAGLLAGLGLGLILARILVDVLNPQVFGWTLSFSIPWPFLGLISTATVAAALLVLAPTARWGSRLGADREVEEGA